MNIKYQCYGDKQHPVLVLLHGNGEDGSYFKNQIPYFEKSYYVITLDMRGHGASFQGNEEYTFALFAHDVIKVMDTLQIDRFSILGFSDGASTAMEVALHYPKRIQTLVLNGANQNPSGVKKLYQIPIAFGYYMVAFLSLFYKKAWIKKQILGLMVKHPNFQKEQLQTIQVPVLILVGDHDMIKENHTRSLAACFKHHHSCILFGNHFIAQKSPIAFNEAVATFLNEHQAYL